MAKIRARRMSDTVGDLGLNAMVGVDRGRRVDQARPAVGTAQQQSAAAGTDPPAVERGGDFLPADTWQRASEKGIGGGGATEHAKEGWQILPWRRQWRQHPISMRFPTFVPCPSANPGDAVNKMG
jgi:hypothetical protein